MRDQFGNDAQPSSCWSPGAINVGPVDRAPSAEFLTPFDLAGISADFSAPRLSARVEAPKEIVSG